MSFLRRNAPYDRNRLLTKAKRAQKRHRTRKAIALYRAVLDREPSDTDVHRRLAPLLARVKDFDASWASYQMAVSGLSRAGFVDQAVGVLREAAEALVGRRAVWEELCEMELQRERPIDAHDALLAGRKHFRGRRQRSDAIQLLMRARKLDPLHFAANFDLAVLLARGGAPKPADTLLEALAGRARGHKLRQVRFRQFRLSPSPARFLRYLRAWIARGGPGLAGEASTIPGT